MVLRWCLYFNNTNSAEIGQLETEHCTKIDVFLNSVRFPGKNKMENSTFIYFKGILAHFANVYVRKFLELSHSRKLLFAIFSDECHSRKFMFAKFLLIRSLRFANPKYIVIF